MITDEDIENMLKNIDRKIEQVREKRKSVKKECPKCHKTFFPTHSGNRLCETCANYNNRNDLGGFPMYE